MSNKEIVEYLKKEIKRLPNTYQQAYVLDKERAIRLCVNVGIRHAYETILYMLERGDKGVKFDKEEVISMLVKEEISKPDEVLCV